MARDQGRFSVKTDVLRDTTAVGEIKEMCCIYIRLRALSRLHQLLSPLSVICSLCFLAA